MKIKNTVRRPEIALEPILAILAAQDFLLLDEAVNLQHLAAEKKCSSVSLLVEHKKAPTDHIALTLSQCLHIDYFDLSSLPQEHIPNNLVDDAFIKAHQVLPLKIEKNILYLGIREPDQLAACEELKFQTNLHIQPVLTDWHKLSQYIAHYLNHQKYQVFNPSSEVIDPENDHRVIHLVQHIMLDAIQKSASDIHFEPCRTIYRIRFRIDGILHEIAQFPIDTAQRITARLKIISKLDIGEKRLPQDGRFKIEMNEKIHKDCRISTCPTLYGEKTVIRILESENISLHIQSLGMEEEQEVLFSKTIKKPQGLILVTGPTGSGKTLTLYSTLNFLNTLDKNILTAEDPVEIELTGINQVNIHPKANLTFASVLRAFLRQDPDILMVGEIRDKETADIAIRAAQTGHLVFSTLHTNTVFETPARLEMMGVSYFNLIDATLLIIAQRLVRKLCKICKSPTNLQKHALIEAEFCETSIDSFVPYTPNGCEHCINGYRGRTGIFELLSITDDLKTAMYKKNNLHNTKLSMQQEGWVNLQKAVLHKIQMGITSLEEAYRVIL